MSGTELAYGPTRSQFRSVEAAEDNEGLVPAYALPTRSTCALRDVCYAMSSTDLVNAATSVRRLLQHLC
eukprot:3939725-Rhodomonas_salina.2